MSTPSYIRWHINNLVGDEPFSIRDFLIYGSRNVVDQVFYRLVESGRVIRVARGVYIKSTSPMPSLTDVVRIKAAAFSRTLATHGSQAARKLTANLNLKWQTKRRYVFACSGATSSFRVGNHVVHLIRASARKMQLADSPVGLAIRALWTVGRKACDTELACALTASWSRSEVRKLRLSAAIMPAWMRDCFASFGRMDCLKSDLPNLTKVSEKQPAFDVLWP